MSPPSWTSAAVWTTSSAPSSAAATASGSVTSASANSAPVASTRSRAAGSTSMPATRRPRRGERAAGGGADEAAGAGDRGPAPGEYIVSGSFARPSPVLYSPRLAFVGSVTRAGVAAPVPASARRPPPRSARPSRCRCCANASRSRRAATVAATAAGPLALAALRPRTRTRDALLFALQMWAFVMVHELPYDDPEALRERLKVRLPDRGRPRDRRRRAPQRAPAAGLLRCRARSARSTACSPRPLGLVLRAARLAGLHPRPRHRPLPALRPPDGRGLRPRLRHLLPVPTAPPWWAGERLHGPTTEVRPASWSRSARSVWGPAWQPIYELARRQPLGGDALASLRRLAAWRRSCSPRPARCRRARLGLRGTLGFALVYLGEHYVIDLIAGLRSSLLVSAASRWPSRSPWRSAGASRSWSGSANG